VKLPPVRVFVDDVEKVWEVVKALEPPHLLLRTDQHDLEAPGDLEGLAHPKELFLSTILEPILTVSLKPGGAFVNCQSLDPKVIGTVDVITGILRRRRRPGASFIAKVGIWFPSLAPSVVLTAYQQDVHGLPLGASWLFAALSLFLALSWWVVSFRRWTLIETRRSTESSTFWQRKGDDVGAGLILMLVSLVVGYLLGKLT